MPNLSFLTNFGKNVPFWGPYLSLKHFSAQPLNLSCQCTSFEYPYDYFLSDDFLTKKVGKLVKTQKFCHHRLNQSFFLQGSYSHHLTIIPKVTMFGLFWSFSNGTLNGNHLTVLEKMFQSSYMIYQKNVREMSLVF